MIRSSLLAAVLAVLVFGAGGSAAQEAAPTPDDPIVVTGQRTREAIRSFVRQMAAAARSENQLARWDRKICPGVAGLQARYAQFLIDRMAQRAFAVDLDVGEPNCRANILIVVTPDAAATTRELVENNRDALGYYYERGRRTLGRRAFAAFENSTAPVRWWHVNHTVTRDGERVGETADASAPVTRLTGNASRLSRTSHQDIGAVYIIVDAQQVRGIAFESLADYLAMAALSQLDPAADTSPYPTILNLFAHAPDGAVAMTDWDLAYLRGLYSATRDAATASRQEGEIARTMDRTLAPH